MERIGNLIDRSIEPSITINRLTFPAKTPAAIARSHRRRLLDLRTDFFKAILYHLIHFRDPDPEDLRQDEDHAQDFLHAARRCRLSCQIHRRVPVHRYHPHLPARLEAVLPARQSPEAALSRATVGQPRPVAPQLQARGRVREHPLLSS